MKKIEVTDELLYKYMPVADERELDALEAELEHEEFVLSQKFENRMQRMIWKEKHKWIADFGKFMIKVAVVCFCFLCISLAVTMSVDAYRSKFFQTVQEMLGDDAVIHTYDTGLDEQGFVPHEPTYIPEGYEEVERILGEDTLFIVYRNSDDEKIIWDQMMIASGDWNITDSEYCIQEYKKMEYGLLTISVYDDGQIRAYYETGRYVYIMTADRIEKEDVYSIFETMK